MPYTHIPRVGRHGMLIELKDDRAYCLILRERIANDKKRSNSLNENALSRIPDENDMCLCGTHGAGGVWSTIMSTLHDDWKEREDGFFGRATGRSDFYDDEVEEMSEVVEYERERAQLYMTKDVSLAEGGTYRFMDM